MLLEVKELEVDFETENGTLHAVRKVSFCVNEGETLAFVGESGCGKSVLCKSMMQLLCNHARVRGQVLFEGENILEFSEKRIRALRGKGIGMVLQDPMISLDPTYSVGSQIIEALLVHEKLTKKEARIRAEMLLEQVGIDKNRFDDHPHHFSGGMRQRVVIAIALACSPKLLIVDEPTTALDVTTQKMILELIRDIQKQTRVAILFITHNLGVVAKVAHRIAVMYAGKIVEIGTASEIFYEPKHPYIWGLMASLPTEKTKYLLTIEGSPPDLHNPPPGDAFAYRNPYALKIDYEKEPPMFEVTPTHYAATWLLHPDAPKIKAPVKLKDGKILVEDIS